MIQFVALSGNLDEIYQGDIISIEGFNAQFKVVDVVDGGVNVSPFIEDDIFRFSSDYFSEFIEEKNIDV